MKWYLHCAIGIEQHVRAILGAACWVQHAYSHPKSATTVAETIDVCLSSGASSIGRIMTKTLVGSLCFTNLATKPVTHYEREANFAPQVPALPVQIRHCR